MGNLSAITAANSYLLPGRAIVTRPSEYEGVMSRIDKSVVEIEWRSGRRSQPQRSWTPHGQAQSQQLQWAEAGGGREYHLPYGER